MSKGDTWCTFGAHVASYLGCIISCAPNGPILVKYIVVSFHKKNASNIFKVGLSYFYLYAGDMVRSGAFDLMI